MGNDRGNADFIVLDSWWLLYTQPVMSEGNTAHMYSNLRCYPERVKTAKNEKYCTTSPLHRAYNYPRSDTLS